MLQKIQRAVDHYTTNNTNTNTTNNNIATQRTPDAEAIFEKVKRDLTDEEVKVMNYIRARQLLRTEDTMHLEHFSTDVIDGLAPVVERGRLTLTEAVPLVGGEGVGGIETRQSIG